MFVILSHITEAEFRHNVLYNGTGNCEDYSFPSGACVRLRLHKEALSEAEMEEFVTGSVTHASVGVNAHSTRYSEEVSTISCYHEDQIFSNLLVF